jgi:uncharacterized lipoprotein YajG
MGQLYRNDGCLDTLLCEFWQRSSLFTANESVVARSRNRSHRTVISYDEDSKPSRHISPLSRGPTLALSRKNAAALNEQLTSHGYRVARRGRVEQLS